MMATVEWLEESDDEAFEGTGWYVVDMNGIVAGTFDSDDEAEWWISKSKRVS